MNLQIYWLQITDYKLLIYWLQITANYWLQLSSYRVIIFIKEYFFQKARPFFVIDEIVTDEGFRIFGSIISEIAEKNV